MFLCSSVHAFRFNLSLLTSPVRARFPRHSKTLRRIKQINWRSNSSPVRIRFVWNNLPIYRRVRIVSTAIVILLVCTGKLTLTVHVMVSLS